MTFKDLKEYCLNRIKLNLSCKDCKYFSKEKELCRFSNAPSNWIIEGEDER